MKVLILGGEGMLGHKVYQVLTRRFDTYATFKARLEAELRRIENRPVHCDYVLDPSIVGGLRVGRGNLVYDASVQGNLNQMKEQIQQG